MYVEIERARIFFDTVGSKFLPGPQGLTERQTLLVLHGGPGYDHSTLRPWFDRFADEYQVMYIDHRGNGRSSGEFADMHLDRWADDIVEICDKLGVEKPLVLGQSFGGMVAMRYAAKYPDHPARLVLSSTAARMRVDESLDVFKRLGASEEALEVARANLTNPTDEVSEKYARLCLPLYNRTPGVAARLPERRAAVVLHFFRNELRHMDLRPLLSAIEAPTLVMGGGQDPITPAGCAAELVEAIGENARLEMFPQCGHGAYRDDPAGAERVLRAFLAAEG